MRCRIVLAALCCSLLMSCLAVGQAPQQLDLSAFEGLQQKATHCVDITIGSGTLGLVRALIPNDDADAVEAKKALSGLKSVRVRSYQFANDFAYSQRDIDAVRSQLSAPAWSQLVHARDTQKNQDVDVYVALDGDAIKGLAVIASEPRELTIVNVVGTLDARDFAKVQKRLGIPGPAAGALAYDM
jgi:Domain of unknown function (DUF4252)